MQSKWGKWGKEYHTVWVTAVPCTAANTPPQKGGKPKSLKSVNHLRGTESVVAKFGNNTFVSLPNFATTQACRCEIWQHHTRIGEVHTRDIIAMFVEGHLCEIGQTEILCICEISQTHSMCVCEISQRHVLCFCEIP